MLVVATADEQHAAMVVGDDAADADRVPGLLNIHDDRHKITSGLDV